MSLFNNTGQKPGGGLFGGGNRPQGGGLFNNNQQPQGGLIQQAPDQNAPRTGGGLFGNRQGGSGGSLFANQGNAGGGTGASAGVGVGVGVGGGGMFGQAQPAEARTSGGLFGTKSSNQGGTGTGGGLFANSAQAGGQLLGNRVTQQSAGGMLGHPQQQAQIFGSTTQSPPRNIFGGPQSPGTQGGHGGLGLGSSPVGGHSLHQQKPQSDTQTAMQTGTTTAPVEEPPKVNNNVKGTTADYISHVKKLFLDTNYSDVTFLIADQKLPAHKNILSMRCKYFENMFTSGMTETNASKIDIPDVSFPTFKALLEFVYCNQVELTYDLALDLLQVSDKYQFPELKNACGDFLGRQLTLENYVEVANASEKFDAQKLRETVLQFVIRNAQQIEQKKDEQPNELSKALLWDIIFKIGRK